MDVYGNGEQMREELDMIFNDMEWNIIEIVDTIDEWVFDSIENDMEEWLYLLLRNTEAKFANKLLIEKIGLIICKKPVLLGMFELKYGTIDRFDSFKVVMITMIHAPLTLILDTIVDMLEK
jgi:hypothetical protein